MVLSFTPITRAKRAGTSKKIREPVWSFIGRNWTGKFESMASPKKCRGKNHRVIFIRDQSAVSWERGFHIKARSSMRVECWKPVYRSWRNDLPGRRFLVRRTGAVI